MFNEQVIEQKKTRAAIHLIRTSPLTDRGTPLFGPGFTLQEHDLFDVSQANIHLQGLLTAEGVTAREFNAEEKRWIINEHTLCSISFIYWATRYGFLVDWKNQLVRFVPNTAQKIVLSLLSEHEGKGLAMLFQILKARQAGITTLAELIILWRTIFFPNSNTLVASSRPQKSETMVGKMMLCLQNQPYWLVPRMGAVKGEKLSFEGQNSFINVRHGAMMSDMGRGDTLSAFHLCFVAGTKVICEDGSLRSIESITPGTGVLTGLGRRSTVTAVTRSERRNEATTKVHLWGCPQPLETTQDHRILTPAGYKEAGLLKKGDFVVFPKEPITNQVQEVEFVQKPVGSPGSRPDVVVKQELTREFGWFCGLYLAEGHVHVDPRWGTANSLIIACHEKELEAWFTRISALFPKLNIKVSRKKDSKTCVINVRWSGLARWINDTFGRVKGKHIPDAVWGFGRDFCLGLLEGYLDGDGHKVPNETTLCVSSIRPEISVPLRSLVASLGLGWSALTFRPAGHYYGRNCSAIWTLHFCGETGRKIRMAFGWDVGRVRDPRGGQQHWKETETQIHIAVKKVEIGYSEEFWNLEVAAEEHNFCTLQCGVANSELIEFADPYSAVDSSLLRAAHDNPSLIGFLESTANGRAGWWFDKWQFNKEFWPQGQSRLCPLFIPWYVIGDLYPTPSWLKAHPIPQGWEAPDLARAHAKRATEYIQSGENSVATRELGAHWEMPLSQIWYWWVERQEYAKNKRLFQWYQEMPADDGEAFQNANPSVFDSELVYEIRERAPRPVGVYGILAPKSEIPSNLQPPERDIDPNQPRIEVKAAWGQNQKPHNYTLVPLLHRGGVFSPAGKLILYERPRAGEIYGVGIDCGFGLDKDSSAIEVLRKGSMERKAAQVGEWVSAGVNSFALWPFAHAIGTLFSTVRGGQLRQPKMVIEGQANGENVYNELKKRGWREFHNWVRLDRKRSPESKANRQLWYTTSWSRPLLMDMFLDAINKGWLEVNSPWFIDEMSDLEMDYTKMRIAAAGGKHDDRIMALGMVLFSLHSRETKFMDQWTSRVAQEEPGQIIYPGFSPGTQGNDRSERVRDATTSYSYRVVRSGDPGGEILREGGAQISPGVRE